MPDMSKFSKYAQQQREIDNATLQQAAEVKPEEASVSLNIAAATDNVDEIDNSMTMNKTETAQLEAYEMSEIYIPPDIIYADSENVAEDVIVADNTEETTENAFTDMLSDEEIKKEIDDITVKYFSDHIQLIETERLLPYRNHTFTPLLGEELESFAKSIDRLGMQDAVLVRSVGSGEYEIISGHNRKLAAELLGWKKVPCRVADNEILTPEIADEIMVSCNLDRRTQLKHSELAKSLSLLMEARKKQQSDDDDKGRTRDKVAAEFGMSHSQVQRYITLSKLNDKLLEMVDSGEIPFVAGTNLAELDAQQQDILLEALKTTKKKINTQISEQLKKKAAEPDKFTLDNVKEILLAKPKSTQKITVPSRIANKYLSGKSQKEAEEIVEKALAMYFERDGDI